VGDGDVEMLDLVMIQVGWRPIALWQLGSRCWILLSKKKLGYFTAMCQKFMLAIRK